MGRKKGQIVNEEKKLDIKVITSTLKLIAQDFLNRYDGLSKLFEKIQTDDLITHFYGVLDAYSMAGDFVRTEMSKALGSQQGRVLLKCVLNQKI
jgi:hypothetical protein